MTAPEETYQIGDTIRFDWKISMGDRASFLSCQMVKENISGTSSAIANIRNMDNELFVSVSVSGINIIFGVPDTNWNPKILNPRMTRMVLIEKYKHPYK